MGQKSTKPRGKTHYVAPPRQLSQTQMRILWDNERSNGNPFVSGSASSGKNRRYGGSRTVYTRPPTQQYEYEREINLELELTEAEKQKISFLSSKIKDKRKKHLACKEVSVGDRHSYDTLFGEYFGPDLTTVLIVEPFFGKTHQLDNLTRLLECIVVNSPSLRLIQVTTKPIPENDIIEQYVDEIATSIYQNHNNIKLVLKFDAELAKHDRKIVLDTGILIRNSYGLHIFRKPPGDNWKFFLGRFDPRLRGCEACSIDIEQFDVGH